MVAVNRIQRKLRYQLQRLAQHIAHRDILRLRIVGIHGQHAFLQRVHHVGAGSLHNNIPHKGIRQFPVNAKDVDKFPKLCFCGKLSKQKQIGRLLKSKTAVRLAPHQILHIDALVIELAVDGNLLAVDIAKGNHV